MVYKKKQVVGGIARTRVASDVCFLESFEWVENTLC